jgi:fumarate reductase iron-sulfur subunit
MKIVVQNSTYEVPLKDTTLLNALIYIRENIDSTLKFGYNCKSGVCGRCSLRVNNQETLSCEYKVQDGDIIEPLLYKASVQNRLKRVESWLHVKSKKQMGEASEEKIERQSDCILCSSCFSACPVLHVKPDFLGPYALTRAWRYTTDIREDDKKGFVKRVQSEGIWDCTLCGECTLACPVGIDPKADILHLRTKSMQMGYFDPTPQPDFQDDFGFNPNF